MACSNGVCVLDCSRMASNSSSQFKLQPQSNSSTPESETFVNEWAKNARIGPPKWRLFGSEADERVFHVLAMTWWEGNTDRKRGIDNAQSDDLLVAIISVRDETKEKKGEEVFLACWSPRQ